MSILKYIRRVERLHWFIKQQATGCTDEFADKMGYSKRQLLEDLRELKTIGAPIKFSSTRNTYYYEFGWTPLADGLSKSELTKQSS